MSNETKSVDEFVKSVIAQLAQEHGVEPTDARIAKLGDRLREAHETESGISQDELAELISGDPSKISSRYPRLDAIALSMYEEEDEEEDGEEDAEDGDDDDGDAEDDGDGDGEDDDDDE